MIFIQIKNIVLISLCTQQKRNWV